MDAGRLNKRVILQSPGGTSDAVGERVTTWTDVATVWASIEPVSVREQFIASQAHASTTHRVRLRHSTALSALDASWRVKYGSRIFVLDGPPRNIQERNIEIELLCTEGPREE